MRIASASSTVSSQFASPDFVTAISVVVVVLPGSGVVVVVVVVVGGVVVVVVVTGGGVGVHAFSAKLMFHAKEACQSTAESFVLHELMESA